LEIQKNNLAILKLYPIHIHAMVYMCKILKIKSYIYKSKYESNNSKNR